MAPQKDATIFGDYFAATRRPIYSIVASAPFFVAYELGVIFLLPAQREGERVYNLAEVLLHMTAGLVGKHAAYILPVAAGMLLLYALHRRELREAGREGGRKKKPAGGRFRLGYLPGMYAEALILALPLPFLPRVLHENLRLSLASDQAGSLLFQLTTVCGAGAYEELLFRLFMFTGFFWMGHKLLNLERLPAGILAAVVSGVVFALFHFVGAQGFNMVFFVFATLAGIYFAAICHFRSFGLAVAAHAIYDIFTVLVRYH